MRCLQGGIGIGMNAAEKSSLEETRNLSLISIALGLG